ncbi:uncharacterized protein [Periplaneta americana]|uniref:uncharacterized protein n=1 Tax=Periplaneta americana TaxID=6978 RepID=UPI0037E95318
MRNVNEKLCMNDWSPMKLGSTEYATQYMRKEVMHPVEHVTTPGLLSECKSRGLGRDEQPAVPPSANSFAKHLDPYISTTHLVHSTVHRGHTSDDRTDVTPILPMRKEPIFDTSVFKTKATNRTVPKFMCRIPHKGKCSETQDKYVHPYHHTTWHYDTKFPATVPAASLWETLSAPNMYCTEYCHIGTGWPVRTAVHIGVQPIFVHSIK